MLMLKKFATISRAFLIVTLPLAVIFLSGVILGELRSAIIPPYDPDDRLSRELIKQLNGKACKYELHGTFIVERDQSASQLRRYDKEYGAVDAARALGMMKNGAWSVKPAMIEALTKYHNVETDDGVIPVRSEIALALGRIHEESAINPLISILASKDPVRRAAGRSVPREHALLEKTSHGDVAEALGMLSVGDSNSEAINYIIPILKYSGTNDYFIYAPRKAAWALGEMKAIAAIPALIEALDNPVCRAEAAEALGKMYFHAAEDSKKLYYHSWDAVPVLESLVRQKKVLSGYELRLFKQIIKDMRGSNYAGDVIYRGFVREKISNGKYGKFIPRARIRFTSEHNAFYKEVESDESGRYTVELPPGRYTVIAFHQEYELYSTGGGYFVVTDPVVHTGNIFLTPLSSTQTTVQTGTAKQKNVVPQQD